jgi:hypothetical protein
LHVSTFAWIASKKKGKRKGKEWIKKIEDIYPRVDYVKVFLHGSILPLVALFLLSKSLLEVLLGWWCLLLPISPPSLQSIPSAVPSSRLVGGNALLFYSPSVTLHRGKKPRSGLKSLT